MGNLFGRAPKSQIQVVIHSILSRNLRERIFIFSHNIAWSLWNFLFLFLSSCSISLSENRQRENIIPSPPINESIYHAHNSGYFALGDWPNENWWCDFNEPSLNELIDDALWQNPSIQQVQMRLLYAQAESVVYRSVLFPYIFFSGEDTYEYLSKNGLYKALNPKIPRSANLIDLRLALNYDFDFWGKNAHLYAASQNRLFAQAAAAKEVQLITTTALAQAFFALKADLERKKLYDQLLEVRQNIYDLQLHLLSSSLSAKLTPLAYEESLYIAKKWVASIESDIAKDRHLINILSGKSPDAPLHIDSSFTKFPSPLSLPCNLSLDLLARRPDLSLHIFQAKALADEVGAAAADFFPDINLKAFIGLESVIASRLFQLSSSNLGVKPALHLPLFTAGALTANLRGKRALFDEAIYSYNEHLLKSAQEVSDLIAFAISIFDQKRKQDEITEMARQRLYLSQYRQLHGLDNLIDTYLLEDELIQKKLDDIDLLYSQYAVSIKLIKALGGGFWQIPPLEVGTALDDC